jgi:hypothetical protein
MEEMYGTNWVLNLSLGFLFSWTIALTPPILLRYLFLKRPVKKLSAIAIVFGFAIFNLALFVALTEWAEGRQGSHTYIVVMAIVSFFILRIGATGKPPQDMGSTPESSESVQPRQPLPSVNRADEGLPLKPQKTDGGSLATKHVEEAASSNVSNPNFDAKNVDAEIHQDQLGKQVHTTNSSPAIPSSNTSVNEDEKKREVPETEIGTDEQWEFFLKYSNIANETITALWERGQANYCAYDYMSELKDFVLSSDVLPGTTDEIVSVIVEKIATKLKISDTDEVQTHYQKIRLVAPDEAGEFKKIVQYLGDTVNLNMLSEKFVIEKIKFPSVEKVGLNSEQYYSGILAARPTLRSQIIEVADEIGEYGYKVENSEGGNGRYRISFKNKSHQERADLEIIVDRRNLNIFLSVCKDISSLAALNDFIQNSKPNFTISSKVDGYWVAIDKTSGVRSFEHFLEFNSLLFFVRCLIFESKLTP